MEHLSGLNERTWMENRNSAFKALERQAEAGVKYMVNMVMSMEKDSEIHASAGNTLGQVNNDAWECEIADEAGNIPRSEDETDTTGGEAFGNETGKVQATECEADTETGEDMECVNEQQADRQRVREAAGEAAERASAKEAVLRAEHDAAEAKRKEEWEAKQQSKKAAEQEQLKRLESMSDQDAIMESLKRISKDTELVTRRNLKECLSEHIQTKCLENPTFARLTMHPQKSMLHCFWYVNRKAGEFIKQEMEAVYGKTQPGMYCSDVPDDLCYEWAEAYFHDTDAKEDYEDGKEDRFIPKPYHGKAASKSKEKKKAEKKQTEKKTDGTCTDKNQDMGQEQLSFIDQLAIPGIEQEVKAG